MTKWTRLLVWILCGLFIFPSLVYAARESVISPQYNMVSPRFSSLGSAAVVLTEDVGGMMLNPAAIAGLSFPQMSYSTNSAYEFSTFNTFQLAFPINNLILDHFVLGLGYGSNIATGFTRTHFSALTNKINPVDTFKSGFQVLSLSGAHSRDFDFMVFDKLSYGLGVKTLQQTIDTDYRTAFGFDVGAIFTKFIPSWYGIDRLHYGGSVVDVFNLGLPAWKGVEANPVGRHLFLGGRLDMLDDTLFIHGGVDLSMLESGMKLGYLGFSSEYLISDYLMLRGGLQLSLSPIGVGQYDLGTGFLFPRVAGFGRHEYNMRLDYNMSTVSFSEGQGTAHSVGFTVLGQARDFHPRLLKPKLGYLTKITTVDFHGIGKPNSLLSIYNNSIKSREVKVNKHGRFNFNKFPLIEGKNAVSFRSKSSFNELSYDSEKFIFTLDTIAPTYNVKVLADKKNKDRLLYHIYVSEKASKVLGKLGKKKITFKKVADDHFVYRVKLPKYVQDGAYITDKYDMLSLRVWDLINNQSKIKQDTLFLAFSSPKDKTVYYTENLTALGRLSVFFDSLKINGDNVYIDKNRTFSHTISLKDGKNLVTVEGMSKDGTTYTYYARLLKMRQFEDIERSFKGRRDIEFLATMGFIDPRPDGLFYPEDNMTRFDLTQFLVKFKGLKLVEPEYDLFLDITKDYEGAAYVKVAVEEGLMVAYPDGFFRPDEPVSVADVFNQLVNSGVIESEDIVVDSTPITRAEFTKLLTQMPSYRKRVEYILNFDRGFTIEKPKKKSVKKKKRKKRRR